MIIKGIILGLILMISIGSNAQNTIVSSDSKVTFSLSNMMFKTVEGSFEGMKGDVSFNSSDLSNSKFNVCIDAATVNTENEKRDDHLRKEDFFHVEEFPTICFVSSTISKSEIGFITKGSLTMHGVTKEIEIPFTYESNIFSGMIKLNRLEYGVGDDFGSFMVGEEVEIKIEAVTKGNS